MECPQRMWVCVHHECLTNAAYAPGWMIRSSVLSFTSLGRLPKKNLSVKVAVTEIDYPKLAYGRGPGIQIEEVTS